MSDHMGMWAGWMGRGAEWVRKSTNTADVPLPLNQSRALLLPS